MKRIGLLRHAKSDWDDTAKRDFDRGLNDRGRRGAKLIGSHIRKEGGAFDMLLASPAERVRQTLASAAIGLDPVWDARLYLASPTTICETVAEFAGDAASVLVAGHNPGLHEMLMQLVPPQNENALFDEAATKFPTATFAVIECDIERWKDIADAKGTLVHFRRPRDLDPALGPVD
ncbi:histidine phosphatase family protein [Qipengyuania sp. JC766]|uniref:SixA phosphatase family protein n=1 Tax=Qipengyuania sp. JC766 TaxID=3232139 RepID=UPI003457EBBE